MMVRRSCLAISALVLGALPKALGHGYIVYPPLRGGAGGNPANAYCPHCGNGAGVCGDGGQWGSSDFLGYTAGPETTLRAGQVVEFEVKVTAHHKGHFEFGICDQRVKHGTSNPQACIDRHKLQRVAPPGDCVPNDARGDCQPVHEAYPERWYLPPGTGTYKMRFKIPEDLHCSQCTLQWRWWTANSCIPAPGYGCFFDQLASAGWDAKAWMGWWPACSTSLLQSNASAAVKGCGEEFRNCADIVVLGSGSGSPIPSPTAPAPAPAPPVATPAPAPTTPPPAAEGACIRNLDCIANAWCAQDLYDSWCAAQGLAGACPSPQCVRAAAGSSTPQPVSPTPMPTPMPTSPSPTPPSPLPVMPTTARPTPTQAPSPSPASPPEACVQQEVLACINDYSQFWPSCSLEQSKSITGPSGYEFGHYCSQDWTDALNEVLSDPVVDKCGDPEAIRRFLAQVVYETGYFSTVYQPRDGGAGLIHMIPGNWQINARDMDSLWPDQDYAGKASSMGKDFFQTASYGWRSVAAWFKRTNRVIGGCGLDLFQESYDTQTRCILSRVVDRQEAYDVVGRCMAAHTSPVPASTPAATTAAPASTVAPSPAPTMTTSSAAPGTTTLPPPTPTTTLATLTTAEPEPETEPEPADPACVPRFQCGEHKWCDQEAFAGFCKASGESGQCHAAFCREEASPEPEPEPEPAGAACMPVFDCSVHSWCDQPGYVAFCSASGAAGQCHSTYCQEELRTEARPEPMHQSHVAALQGGARLTRSRRHDFLGTALVQARIAVQFKQARHDDL